jgi:hypothetical protein
MRSIDGTSPFGKVNFQSGMTPGHEEKPNDGLGRGAMRRPTGRRRR